MKAQRTWPHKERIRKMWKEIPSPVRIDGATKREIPPQALGTGPYRTTRGLTWLKPHSLQGLSATLDTRPSNCTNSRGKLHKRKTIDKDKWDSPPLAPLVTPSTWRHAPINGRETWMTLDSLIEGMGEHDTDNLPVRRHSGSHAALMAPSPRLHSALMVPPQLHPALKDLDRAIVGMMWTPWHRIRDVPP